MEKKQDSNAKVISKLRILMLHGYFQSGPIFQQKTGGFRKLFKNVEFGNFKIFF